MNQHLRFISEEAGGDAHVILIPGQARLASEQEVGRAAQRDAVVPPAVQSATEPIEKLWGFARSHYMKQPGVPD